MHKIAILLKTYIGDIEYVERLILSYQKHNIDHIPLYVVVPSSDIKVFEKIVDRSIELHTDEWVTNDLVNDSSVFGIRPGYINQEIVKLAFWEKQLCENYFCIDSEGVFVRDFFVADFLYDDETPYTILVEDNELKVEPEYYFAHWIGREKLIRKIQEEVGLMDERILTSHGFAVFSCKVLESFYNNYLIPMNRTYIDILKISPYEFSWYNMWLQKDKAIRIEFREPLFKTFHHKNQHLEYLKKGITLQDIARGYIGVVINSNYSRGYGVVSYEDGDIYDLSLTEIKSSLKEITSLFYKIIKSCFRSTRSRIRKVKGRLQNLMVKFQNKVSTQ